MSKTQLDIDSKVVIKRTDLYGVVKDIKYNKTKKALDYLVGYYDEDVYHEKWLVESQLEAK